MKPKYNEKYNTYALFALIVVAFVGVLISLFVHADRLLALWSKLLAATFPLLCAAVTLLVLLPLYDLLTGWFAKLFRRTKHQKKLATVFALIGSYLALFGVLTLLIVVILPQFKPLYEMIMNSADYLSRLNSIGEEIASHSDFLGERFLALTASLNEQIVSSLSEFSTYVPSIIAALKNVVSHISGWIFGFIISVYALAARDRLKAIARKLNAAFFKEKTASRLERSVKLLYGNTLYFLSARAYNALILGGTSCLLFYFAGLRFYATLCVTLMLGSFVPVFGTPAAGALGCVIVLLTDTPLFGWYFLLLVLLATLDHFLLVPRITKPQVRLTFGAAMICVLIGWFFGRLFGAVFAAPLYVTLRTLVFDLYHARKAAATDPANQTTKS